MNNNSCYNCEYKRNLPYDSHFKCKYPFLTDESSMHLASLSIVNIDAFINNVEDNFGFSVNKHGIQNGWFSFPENYDPVWMIGECNKHSNFTKEAVKYKEEMDSYIKPFFTLLNDIDNGRKNKVDYQDVLDKYDETLKLIKDKGFSDKNASESKKEEGRKLLLANLKNCFDYLKEKEG